MELEISGDGLLCTWPMAVLVGRMFPLSLFFESLLVYVLTRNLGSGIRRALVAALILPLLSASVEFFITAVDAVATVAVGMALSPEEGAPYFSCFAEFNPDDFFPFPLGLFHPLRWLVVAVVVVVVNAAIESRVLIELGCTRPRQTVFIWFGIMNTVMVGIALASLTTLPLSTEWDLLLWLRSA